MHIFTDFFNFESAHNNRWNMTERGELTTEDTKKRHVTVLKKRNQAKGLKLRNKQLSNNRKSVYVSHETKRSFGNLTSLSVYLSRGNGNQKPIRQQTQM